MKFIFALSLIPFTKSKCFFVLLVASILSLQYPGPPNHRPVFKNNNYSYTVLEDIAPGDSVGTVAAIDESSNPLTYAIKSGNTNGALSIDSFTGLIKVARRLNHHTQDSFSLVVRATNPDGVSNEALVFIKVIAGVRLKDFTDITWVSAVSQPYGTHEVHGEVVNGKLYIFGGYDVEKRPKFIPTKRSFVYDPKVKTWTSIADLPNTPNGADFGGITHEGLTTDGTDIYFAGGYPSNSNGTSQVFGTKQVWKYDVSSNTYSPLPDLPIELATGQLKYLHGKLHYLGGANKFRRDTSVHFVLNLDSLSQGWKVLAPVLNGTNHPGSAVYEGKIYYLGGSHFQDAKAIQQKTVEVYDPNTNAWTILADLPVARDHISSSVVVAGDRIIVLAGETVPGGKSTLVSAYSPASDTWQDLTSLRAARAAGVAGILNGNIYYSGGNFNNTNFKGMVKADTIHFFSFTGDGKWSNPINWDNNVVPPAILIAGDSIIINGHCILDVSQTIKSGAIIKVASGKSLLIPDSLIIK